MESLGLIGGRYQLGKYLGHGSFGQIMLAVNITKHNKVAIKIEPITDIITNYEAEILKSLSKIEGFPKFYERIEQDNCSYLVMQRLGNNLYKLLKKNGGKFSIHTVALIGLQLCTRLEELHKLGYLHRDIKPHQILTGYKDQARLYLIDYGLSRKYKISSMHIPYKSDCSKAGNATFASLNVHNGIQQSRRDDMESYSYLLLYLLNGTLPWQNISSHSKNEKWNKIALLKSKCNFSKVCAKLPNEFLGIINHCKSLSFDASPNYDYIRSLLSRLLASQICLPDWLSKLTIPKKGIKKRKESESTRSESSFGSKAAARKNKRQRMKTIFSSKGPELNQRLLRILHKLERTKHDTGFEMSVDSVSHESEQHSTNAFIVSDTSMEGFNDSIPQSGNSSTRLDSHLLAVKTSFLYERKETIISSLPSLSRSVRFKMKANEETKIQISDVKMSFSPSNEDSQESRGEPKCILF